MPEQITKNSRPSPNNTKIKPNNDLPKKKKKKISGGAVFSIILIIGIVGVLAMVYLNIGGLKETVGSMLGFDLPTAEQLAVADEATAAAQEKQDMAEEQEQQLSSLTRELAKKEQELTAKEQALSERETALEGKEELIDQGEKTAEQEKTDLEATVLIFEQMEAAKAAEAISGMDTEADMARVLINMTSERAAAIVNEMDPALVTKIFQQ